MCLRRCLSFALFVLILFAAASAGCRAKEDFAFDELDLTPAQDELIEFALGKYSIPIPLVRSTGMDDGLKRNRVEFSFALYALVTADCKSRLTGQWKRHEGKLRERIILVCRNATGEELQEPELATLKSHLTDAVQAELGSQCIRRLLISEVITRKL
jgi:Flagellar basal body-associated protein FliL